MSDRPVPVRPSDVSSYLASKGWERDGDWNGASVWRLDGKARLLVPDVHAYDDADQLIGEAVAKIARYEQRPEDEVARDIAEPMTDAQFFRLHPDTPSGFIPLPAGVKAAQAILDLLKTAATAAEQGPRLLFEGQRTPLVNDFLHGILLGSAAPGSYILTARVPTSPLRPTQQLNLFDEEEDLATAPDLTGRTVIAGLHESVRACRLAAEQALQDRGELGSFYGSDDDPSQPVLSANLCRALSELGGEGRNQPFEVGFSWARGVPVSTRDAAEPVEPEVAFTSAMPTILHRAANELETLALSGRAMITGEIIALYRRQPGEQSRVRVRGEFRVGDQARGKQRPVWVVLTPAQYDQAWEAHQTGLQVEAEGNLATTDRRLQLRARTFRVLPG